MHGIYTAEDIETNKIGTNKNKVRRIILWRRSKGSNERAKIYRKNIPENIKPFAYR
jgi:hypothetical protein